jgi:hypothetical protein
VLVIIYFKDARHTKFPNTEEAENRGHGLLKGLMTAVVMVFGFVTFILGFVDLRSFTMCFVEAEVSLPIAILLGSFATILTISAVTVLSMKFWAKTLVSKTFTLSEEEKSIQLDLSALPQ